MKAPCSPFFMSAARGAGVVVPGERVFRPAELLGVLGPEVREDAEPRLEGLGLVEVVAVAAAPAERLPVGGLEAGQVHAAIPGGERRGPESALGSTARAASASPSRARITSRSSTRTWCLWYQRCTSCAI